MSRGIGKTQQRILDEIESVVPPPPKLIPLEHDYALTVTELVQRTEVPERQVRRAVRALEPRNRLVITKGTVWHGEGRYGRLVKRRSMHNDYGPEVPTARVVFKGEPWPWKEGYVAAQDTDLVHSGMPTVALWVWSIENRVAYLAEASQSTIRFGGAPSEHVMDEYVRLTGLLPST